MASVVLPADPSQRYFEDYVVGLVAEYGPATVDADEIIAFGRRYDPQVFHVDPVRAAHGEFGGLIASGWQTAGLMMRLLVDHFLSPVASLGSPGIDELRWLAPVRPGDRLTARVTVIEARRSRSKPHLGVVRTFIEMLNQDRKVVMTVKGMTMMRCRNPAAEAATSAARA
ncbi:MAG: MaoC family dehydratase [Gemmatimonadota bacterium]